MSKMKQPKISVIVPIYKVENIWFNALIPFLTRH